MIFIARFRLEHETYTQTRAESRQEIPGIEIVVILGIHVRLFCLAWINQPIMVKVGLGRIARARNRSVAELIQ